MNDKYHHQRIVHRTTSIQINRGHHSNSVQKYVHSMKKKTNEARNKNNKKHQNIHTININKNNINDMYFYFLFLLISNQVIKIIKGINNFLKIISS